MIIIPRFQTVSASISGQRSAANDFTGFRGPGKMRESDADHLICVFSFIFVRGSQPVYSVLVLGVVVLQQHYAKTHKKKFKLFQEKNA